MSKDQERADEFCKRLPMLTKKILSLEEENSWEAGRDQSRQQRREREEQEQFDAGIGRLTPRQRDLKYRLLREGQKVPNSLMYKM